MENLRLQSVKAVLKEKNLSHILISDLIDVEYLTGFRSSNVVLLLSANKNLLFSDFRYKDAATAFCKKNPQWKFELVKEGLFSSVRAFIPDGSLCGFQANDMTVERFEDLKKHCRKVKFFQLTSEISDIFIQKTTSEITSMRKAAQIGDKAFEMLLNRVELGITEIELARQLESYCLQLGSQKPSFETIVLFGSRAALPHGRPGKQKLKKGNFVLIDFGCTVNGFCSDMTRTFVFGKANPRQRFIYQTVLEAQKKACEAARAGITTKELDSIARTQIEAAGYAEAFGHALGHGVGLRIHEKPRVSPHTDQLLKENMVITIEPGIYLENFGGVRIEDMVVLKKTGAQLLTSAPKELIEL